MEDVTEKRQQIHFVPSFPDWWQR